MKCDNFKVELGEIGCRRGLWGSLYKFGEWLDLGWLLGAHPAALSLLLNRPGAEDRMKKLVG